MRTNVSAMLVRAYPFLLLAIILAGFAVAGFQQVLLNTKTDALDQGAYLSIGLAAREEFHLTDPYRQPLFSWLAAPGAQREIEYFTRAKLLALATGIAGVIGCFVVSLLLYRRPVAAILSAFLLACNIFYIQESATIMVEPLLGLIFLAVWFLGVSALTLNRWALWAAGGFAAGLAYLAKESGLLWLPAWAAGALIANRTRFRAYRMLLLFLLLVILTLSPMLVYNTARYGKPLLTENISTQWFDDWEQFFSIGPDAHVTMLDYLEDHTVAEMFTRLFGGTLMMGALSVSVFVPFRLDQALCDDWCKPYGPMFAALVIAILLALSFRRPLLTYCREKASLVGFSLTFLVLYFAGASWRVPVTFDPRYVVPLLPMGYVMIGGATLHAARYGLGEHSRFRHRLRQGSALVLGHAILIWASGMANSCREASCLVDPFENDRQANRTEIDAMRAIAPDRVGETVIVYQPSHDLPVWLVEGQSRIIAVPSNVDWSHFSTYLKEQQAQYVVMTPELYQRRQGLFRRFMYPSWPVGSKEQSEGLSMGIRILPAAWGLYYADQGMPSPYYVFRISPLPPGAVGLGIERGDAQVSQGNWDEAKQAYRSALAGWPPAGECGIDCERLRGQIARALAQIALLENRHDEALDYLDKAIASDPGSAWYRMLRGEVLSVTGGYEAAAQDYAAARDLSENEWSNLSAVLAWIDTLEGNRRAAIEGYRKALRFSPANPWYQALLGQVLADEEMFKEATVLFEDIVSRKIPWPFVHSELTDIYRLRGLSERAVAAVDASNQASEPLDVNYPDGLHLTGYSIETVRYVTDGKLTVALSWIPPAGAGREYRVHAKLVNAVFDVWGEGRGNLERQGVPNGAWASAARLQDEVSVAVQPGTPPGSYTLELEIQDITLEQWLEPVHGANIELGPLELPRRPLSPAQLGEIRTRTAVLGDQIALLGYQREGDLIPGESILLTLFWQAREKPAGRYTVFTHLTDASGRLWAQKDSEPVDGFHPTTDWAEGEIVRDHYVIAIPPDVPDGKYTLQVGLYDAQTGRRLTVSGEAGSLTHDSIVVEELFVSRSSVLPTIRE